VAEAQKKIVSFPSPLTAEKVPLAQSLGRTLAAAAVAKVSSPAFNGAAMDGVAVKAEITYGARASKPLTLEIGREAFWVNTGAPLPPETNAVIMVENLVINQDIDPPTGAPNVTIEEAVFPWRNVRKIGEDLVETEIVLPQGTAIGAYEIGALAAAGILEPMVFRKPQVVFIPTGSEMASLDSLTPEDLKAGHKLPEFNSLIVQALVEEVGGRLTVWPIVPDDPGKLKETLLKAVDGPFDLIVFNAGSSAGSKDYTAGLLQENGELLVHGIKAMPGKPVAIGKVNQKPVLGLPGYPVSAVIAFELLGLPLLKNWQSAVPLERPNAQVRLFQDLPSKPGLSEFIRVKLGRVNGELVAAPLPRGAGTVASLAKADGIIEIPAISEGLSASQPATVSLLRPLKTINGAILAIGSHDNALALIDGLLRRRDPKLSLTSAHVGSLGGLLALGKGLTHIAGCHLLGEDGTYNQEAIRRFLPGRGVTLIRLVERSQGLMVLRGNPLKIVSLADLTRPEVTMVNRQKGSGTRALLDYELRKSGLDPQSVRGYEDEEFTHLNVAAAVAGGRAQVGLGVLAAAMALGLEFIPLGWEEYDLAILKRDLNDPKIQVLLEIIRGPEFQKEAGALGGYGFKRTGAEVFSLD
jgi:putative molybdopterin biosynthesis protein